jgi:tape measure domain-containing protein
MANIKLTASEEKFVQSINRASGAVGAFAAKLSVDLTRSYAIADRQQSQFNKGLGRFADKLTTTGQNLSFVSAGLLALSGASLKAFSDLQAIEKGLEAIEGSSAAASDAITRIKKIAQAPGLGLEDAAQGYTNLRAIGFEAGKAERTLIEFGNALALSGKGKAELGAVLTQLTQMSSKSKVLAEDLKPILNAIPSVAKILRDEFGTVDSEEISKKLQQSGVSTTQFIELLVSKLSELDRVSGTFKNTRENLSDGLRISGAIIGEVINKVTGLQGFMDSLSTTLVSAAEGFEEMNPTAQAFIVTLGGIAIAAGPVLATLGFLTSSVIPLVTAGFTAMIGTAGLVALGLAAIAGGIAVFIDYKAKMADMAAATISAGEAMQKAKEQTKGQREEIQQLVGVLKNEKSSQDEVNKAKARLLEISPTFRGALQGSKIDFNQLATATSDYVTQIQNAAKAEVLYASLQKNLALQQKEKEDPGSSLSFIQKTKAFFDATKGGNGDIKRLFENFDKEVSDQSKVTLAGLRTSEQLLLKALGDLGGVPSKAKPTTSTAIDITPAVKVDKEKLKKNIDFSMASVISSKPFDPKPFLEMYVNMLTPTAETDAIIAQKFKTSLDKIPTFIKTTTLSNMAALSAQIAENVKEIGVNFGVSLIEGIVSGKGIKGAFSGLLTDIGSEMIRIGKQFLVIDGLIKKARLALGTIGGPGAAIALIAGGAVLRGLAQSQTFQGPKFANGGIVSGPTIGMVGEYAGASNNPEVIAPLDKLKNMLGGSIGQNGYIAETKVSGDDLFVLLKRIERKRNG